MFTQRVAGVVVISSNKTQRELHYSVQSTCGNISSVAVSRLSQLAYMNLPQIQPSSTETMLIVETQVGIV